ncbi:hypothetical protein [Variovorax sp. CCNWLW235]|uniref:hypothetical protein n=1 Tax=Variovorax sp. CCNWLW235 TaxID=3127463 RepID=UPI003076D3C1
MSQMAVMVSEEVPGEFRFSLLGSVKGSRGVLSFRPFVSDQTAHQSAMEAWIAGACAMADHLVRPSAPKGTDDGLIVGHSPIHAGVHSAA